MRLSTVVRLFGVLCLVPFVFGSQPLEAAAPPVLAPGQSATLLPDGRWLLIGGEGSHGPVDTMTIWTPATGGTVAVRRGLDHPRAWHTATLLPDGTVLIVGGWGARGVVVEAVERFDPASASVRPEPIPGLRARAAHSATLLTEGRVLFVGGVAADGRLLDRTELWDPEQRGIEVLTPGLATARAGHTAQLLPDGTVWISGGVDPNGSAPAGGERYHPDPRHFTVEPPRPAAGVVLPEVSGSEPTDGATGVPVGTTIAVRFSTPLDVPTLSDQTVFLTGGRGLLTAQVTPAEGMLVFLTPGRPLDPGTTYAVTLNGPMTADGEALPFTELRFTTRRTPGGGGGGAGGTGGGGDSGGGGRPSSPGRSELDWVPTPGEDWTMDAAPSPWQALEPRIAPPGVTALAGQVLTLRGDPLSDVTLRMDGQETRTDRTGRFLLGGLSDGRRVLLIDGQSATRPGRVYGVFEVGVELIAGRTTVLPYTIWMPRIDTAHAVRLESPTTGEVVITTPHIPGLEVRIPAGTVITDHAGHVVRQLTVTPIPLDRPPFPLAPGVIPPAYFTIQPGGGYVSNPQGQGVRVVYPNTFRWPPGQRGQFYHYDPEDRGWYVYGFGSVTSDRRQIQLDPGVGLYEFTGQMFATCPTKCPPSKGTGNIARGDPVDVTSGLFVYRKTDLVLPDTLPIVLTRTYRPGDPASGPFGIGTMHPYEMYLWSAHLYTEVDLIFPDGGRLHYVRTSPGTGYLDAVFEHTATPTPFYKSRLAYNTTTPGWDLTLKDGTVLVFGDISPLQGIRDRFGNTLTLTRTGGLTGNITRITSPNNHWIDFTYDASNRVTQAIDQIGRAVSYSYDVGGRLTSVTDAAGGVTAYTYDANHRMLTITDPRGIVFLTNAYDANDRVTRQTLADGTTFQFAYTVDGAGKVTQTDVTDPRGFVERLTFNADGYVLTDTLALGQPGQQTVTYVRETGTNAPLTVTDALGRQTTYTYDANRNVTSVTRPAGTADAVTTTYTYEPTFNQVASITDPLNHTTNFTYDSKGALVTITNPLSQQTTLTVNAAGQPTSIRDPLNNMTQFGYDFGDLVTITDPLGNVTRRFVDGAGRLVAVTDPKARTTRFESNSLNRLTRIIDTRGGVTTLTYDGNGNLLSVTDARSSTTTYTYNSMDLIVTRTDPLTRQETYQYDNNGNLAQATDRKNQVTTYIYDALNRRTQTNFGDASTTSYGYDAGNRLTSIVDSVAGTVSWAYDGLDRLTQETTPEGLVSYTYDAAGRRTGMTVGGQPAVAYAYDAANRLTSITQGSAAVGFSYDVASRRTNLTLPNGIAIEYAYDTASRLTGLTYRLGGTTLGAQSYAYDAAGARMQLGGTWGRTGLPQGIATTNYNANDQQLVFGGATMTFDLNGNVATRSDGSGTRTYTWNARNQLTALSGPSLSATFGYDGLGRRRTKTINAARTDFLYDGLNPVQEGVLPATPGANLLTGLAIDEYFVRTDGAGASYLLPDALGSTLALASASGAVMTEYEYEPFGTSATTGAGSSNSLEYTGRENDHTGLYNYRARYYDPAFARFISEDPLGQGYAYAANAPLNFIDPLGLCYVDLNLTAGVFVTATGGVMISCSGPNAGSLYPYLGGGVALPSGFGASLTISNQDPSPGWNQGVQIAGGPAYQYGKDSTGEKFEEGGIGTLGVSVLWMYVFGPVRPNDVGGPRGPAGLRPFAPAGPRGPAGPSSPATPPGTAQPPGRSGPGAKAGPGGGPSCLWGRKC